MFPISKKKIILGLFIITFFSVALAIAQKPSFEIAPQAGPTIQNTAVSPASGDAGQIFTITADVSDVSGVASVIAHIQNPDETDIALVTLYDDGAHSDGAASDGKYGNTWDSTAKPIATYQIDIVANDTLGYFSEDENGASFNIVAACTPTCATGPGCRTAALANAHTTGDICCGAGEDCYDCDAGYSWDGSNCVAVASLIVSITSPQCLPFICNEPIFYIGDSITFDSSVAGGTAPYSYVWNSNIDGNIGISQTFSKNNLSVGNHTITLTVTDSTAATATDSIDIHILPNSFDWRNISGQNWMTSVKDQGACGSCWAFATLGSIEAKYNIEQNNPALDINLSEQYLVSNCCPAGDCSGGNGWNAFGFINTTGVPTEACYPYLMVNSPCPIICNGGAPIELWKITSRGFNNLLQKKVLQHTLIVKGPLYINIGAGGWADSGKKDGDGCIIYNCGAIIDHGVVLVGYNNTDNYWIIKNSWGLTGPGPCGDGFESIDYTNCPSVDQGFYGEGITFP